MRHPKIRRLGFRFFAIYLYRHIQCQMLSQSVPRAQNVKMSMRHLRHRSQVLRRSLKTFLLTDRTYRLSLIPTRRLFPTTVHSSPRIFQGPARYVVHPIWGSEMPPIDSRLFSVSRWRQACGRPKHDFLWSTSCSCLHSARCFSTLRDLHDQD